MDKEQVRGLDDKDVDWRSNFMDWTVKPGLEEQVWRFGVANSCTGAAGGPESKIFKQNQVKFQLVRKLLTIGLWTLASKCIVLGLQGLHRELLMSGHLIFCSDFVQVGPVQ